LRFGAGCFVIFAGVGASEPVGVFNLVTGRPTWSRETTYAAYPSDAAPKRPTRATATSVRAARICHPV
jgi:hypothetical protein